MSDKIPPVRKVFRLVAVECKMEELKNQEFFFIVPGENDKHLTETKIMRATSDGKLMPELGPEKAEVRAVEYFPDDERTKPIPELK